MVIQAFLVRMWVKILMFLSEIRVTIEYTEKEKKTTLILRVLRVKSLTCVTFSNFSLESNQPYKLTQTKNNSKRKVCVVTMQIG